MTTCGVLLVMAVGVGRGSPPSAPASPSGPTLAPAPIPALPAIPPARLNWAKAEKVDTPVEKAETKKLKDEVDKLMNEHPEPKPGKTEPADERERLQKKLDELLEQLKEQKKNAKPMQPPAKPQDPHAQAPNKPVVIPEGGKPIDLVRAAGNLYKAGDLEGAFGIIKVLDVSQLPKEDRAFAEYIRAACLRKLGKLSDALTVYKAIADAKDDAFLAECAVVQITAIKSTQELEAQLEQLKSRRKPK
jgi:hypothetical protein